MNYCLVIIAIAFFSCNTKVSPTNIPRNEYLIAKINSCSSFLKNKKFNVADSICVSLIKKMYKDSLFYSEDSLCRKRIDQLLVRPKIIAVMDLDTSFIEISYVLIDENYTIYDNKIYNKLLGFGISQKEVDYSIDKAGIKHKINISSNYH